MVTLRDGPPRSEWCGRPNCPTCNPVAVEHEPVVAAVESDPDAPPPRSATKVSQAKAAIRIATGVDATSLDDLTRLDDNG